MATIQEGTPAATPSVLPSDITELTEKLEGLVERLEELTERIEYAANVTDTPGGFQYGE